MKKILTLPFLILLFTVLTSMPVNFTFAASDLDNDGVDDAVDACPNLSEDNEGVIDGCPSNFVPWYDEDLMELKIILINVLTLKKIIINSKTKMVVLIIPLTVELVDYLILMEMDLQTR